MLGRQYCFKQQRGVIFRPDKPDTPLEARIIFDCGSQQLYSTSAVKNALLLPTESIETMTIKTFASDEGRVEVRLAIRTRDGGKLKLPLLTMPLICKLLIRQLICYAIEAHPCLSELDLADLPGDGGELAIRVLIGSDHYWNLVTDEVTYQDNCPTAVKTLLGLVLSGPIEGLTENLSLNNYTSIYALKLESYLTSYEDYR